MSEKNDLSDLLKRKFEPASDWKPAGGSSAPLSGVKALVGALESVMQNAEQTLGPISDDAKAKVREILDTASEVADRSTTEARSALSKALSVLAEKIKP
ncbi:MAG: hypothetical protein V1792_24850 [Pseudomonadota bacterium]